MVFLVRFITPSECRTSPCLSLRGEEPRLTQPFTAVELHPHTHDRGGVGDGHKADEAGDDGGLEILQDHIVGVLVALDDLREEMQGVQIITQCVTEQRQTLI